MLRLTYVIFISLPFVVFFLCKAHYVSAHEERYTEEQRYRIARWCISLVMRNGRIETLSYGQEHLPEQGGYVMYSNHQGKYDTLGIMASHPKPCTILMDADRSKLPIVDSFIDLVGGSRLDRSNMKEQMNTILKISDEVKAGRRYIVFPEGGYDNNRNHLQEFRPGSFQCAVRARVPIVPVAIIDSYKPFGYNSLRKVRTQVHFLKPIPFEEYAAMTTPQIAAMVKQRITEEISVNLKTREA